MSWLTPESLSLSYNVDSIRGNTLASSQGIESTLHICIFTMTFQHLSINVRDEICAGLYGYVRYVGLECAELCQEKDFAFRLGGLHYSPYADVLDMCDSCILVIQLILSNLGWLIYRPCHTMGGETP